MLPAEGADELPLWVISVLPFVSSVVLLGVGQAVSWFLKRAHEDYVAQALAATPGISEGKSVEMYLPTSLASAELAQRLAWQLDLVQVFAVFLTPTFGLAIVYLTGHAELDIWILLLLPAVSIILFLTLLGLNPGRYDRWSLQVGSGLSFSFLTWSGVVLNLAAAVLAVFASR